MMEKYLGDIYNPDNHIWNFLNYWNQQGGPRYKNDLDCMYLMEGKEETKENIAEALYADTIFSVWTIMRFVLECLHKEKQVKFVKYGRSDTPNINVKKLLKDEYFYEYFPMNSSLVKALNEFAELAETRANTMRLKNRKMQYRYASFWDQMPPTIYNCFNVEGSRYSKYFDGDDDVINWIKKEKLVFFFRNEEVCIENIIPIIDDKEYDVNSRYYFDDEKTIVKLLENMRDILKKRLEEF